MAIKRFKAVRISLFALLSAVIILSLAHTGMEIWLSNLNRWTAVELIAIGLPALILYTVVGLAKLFL